MLSKRIFAAICMVGALSVAMYFDLTYFKDSILLHAVFLVGIYFSFREFWPMCRATNHQTFSIWGTFSGCGMVIIHYWCMQLANLRTERAMAQAWNLSSGALA